MFVLPRSQIKAIFEVYFGKRRNHILRDDCYLTDDKEVEEKVINEHLKPFNFEIDD